MEQNVKKDDNIEKKGNVKKESDVKAIVVLTFIAFFSAFLLAYVYSFTKVPISKVKENELKEGIKKVVGDFDKLSKEYKIDFNKHKLSYFKCFDKEGKVKYIVVKTYSNKGYGGKIVLLVGIDLKGHITGVLPLQDNETPGLGKNMYNKSFRDQFIGKGLDNFIFKVKKDGGDVKALTSATITSRAVSQALDLALKLFKKQGW